MAIKGRFFFGVDAEDGRIYETSPDGVRAADDLKIGPRKLPFGVDSSKLNSSGWGLVHPENLDHAVLDALEPLLAHRQAEAGRLFRIEVLERDFCHLSAAKWLSEHASSRPVIDPEETPYHLLIVGGPSEIPLTFDLGLGRDFSVGRLHFEHPEAYRRYAETVVDVEQNGIDREPKICLFGPSNPNDPATTFSHDQLMAPLKDDSAQFLRRRGFSWSLEGLLGADATKEQLCASLSNEQSPTVLMASSQSLVSAKLSNSENLGALICQNWPGPVEAGGISLHRSYFFGHADLGPEIHARGLIAVFLGSFSAGVNTSGLGEPALSHLPTKLLSHENGSALAVIGSVASNSVCSDDDRDLRGIYSHLLRRIALGSRIGACLHELKSSLRSQHRAPQDDRLRKLALCRAHDSLILLGDPAVLSAVSDPKLYSQTYTGS